MTPPLSIIYVFSFSSNTRWGSAQRHDQTASPRSGAARLGAVHQGADRPVLAARRASGRTVCARRRAGNPLRSRAAARSGDPPLGSQTRLDHGHGAKDDPASLARPRSREAHHDHSGAGPVADGADRPGADSIVGGRHEQHHTARNDGSDDGVAVIPHVCFPIDDVRTAPRRRPAPWISPKSTPVSTERHEERASFLTSFTVRWLPCASGATLRAVRQARTSRWLVFDLGGGG